MVPKSRAAVSSIHIHRKKGMLHLDVRRDRYLPLHWPENGKLELPLEAMLDIMDPAEWEKFLEHTDEVDKKTSRSWEPNPDFVLRNWSSWKER